MFFGGIQKSSLIDYPGKVSCVLFVSGCNFTCPYCHNPELARGHLDDLLIFSEEEALGFLESRHGFLDGVSITGGEPTLQQGLAAFCSKVKALGYPVKLDTNGSRPEALRHLLDEKLVDYVAMDIKTDPKQYAPLICNTISPDQIITSIRNILCAGIPHEFRTTCLAPFVDAEIVSRIAELIEGADLYVLQQFHKKSVLDTAFVEEKTRRYTDKELAEFQSIATPFVKRCIVR